MTFPLIIFLYAYYAFLIVWVLLSLIGFYHLARFGRRMFGSFFVGLLYIAGSLIILSLSYTYLSTIEWATNVTIFQGLDNLKSIFNGPTVFN